MLRCNPDGVAELLPMFGVDSGSRTEFEHSVGLDPVVEGRGVPDPVDDDLERGRSGSEAAVSQHVGEDGQGAVHLEGDYSDLKVAISVEAGQSAGPFPSWLKQAGEDHRHFAEEDGREGGPVNSSAARVIGP